MGEPNRTREAREYAELVLRQDVADFELVEDYVMGPGLVEKRPRLVDLHPRALRDPVLMRLREQARNGVGSGDGDKLPAQVFKHLDERLGGKVPNTMRVEDARTDLSEASDEELREMVLGEQE